MRTGPLNRAVARASGRWRTTTLETSRPTPVTGRLLEGFDGTCDTGSADPQTGGGDLPVDNVTLILNLLTALVELVTAVAAAIPDVRRRMREKRKGRERKR